MADAEDKNISYKPTDGLCYDPSEPKYWDEGALGKADRALLEEFRSRFVRALDEPDGDA